MAPSEELDFNGARDKLLRTLHNADDISNVQFARDSQACVSAVETVIDNGSVEAIVGAHLREVMRFFENARGRIATFEEPENFSAAGLLTTGILRISHVIQRIEEELAARDRAAAKGKAKKQK